MPPVTIHDADHRDPRVARAIHAVQMAAYAQEARLLGARDFPPLRRTPEDIRRGDERFLVASDHGLIVGAVGIETGATPGELLIGSLVVAPDRWREGIGRRLVQAVIDAHGAIPLTVSTGVKNLPGLALYAACGFVEYARDRKGPDPIDIVLLRRAPSH